MNNKRIILILFIVSNIVLILNTINYLPFLSDDALISLRYADRLLNGDGLTWTDGKAVEGYSNLLWVLLNALLGKLGLNLVLSLRILGYSFSIANIVLLIDYVQKRTSKPTSILLIPLFIYSASSIVATWTIGGLEQPLVAFLTMFSLIKFIEFTDSRNYKKLLLSSVAAGLLCISRPDGILFVASISLFMLFSAKKQIAQYKGLIYFLVVPMLFFIGQIVFRLYYYGEFVPNTAFVKVTSSLTHTLDGIMYNLRFFKANFSLVPVFLFSLYYLYKKNRDRFLLYLILLTIWFLYISYVGGDIFAAFRHHFYSLVIIILLFTDTLLEIDHNEFIRLAKKPVVYSLIILLSLFYIYQQIENNNYTRTKTEVWEWQLRTLSLELKNTFRNEKPLIAIDAAGSLPYWTQFPAVDMLGLNDYHIARHSSKRFGEGYLGHELGDDVYIMNRNPDIVQFHIGFEFPRHYADTLLYSNEEFQNKFICVPLLAEGHYTFKDFLYFNKLSRIVGIKESKKQIEIPGYFFKNEVRTYNIFKNNKLVRPLVVDEKVSFTIPFEYNTFELTPKQEKNLKITIDSANVITVRNISSDETVFSSVILLKK